MFGKIGKTNLFEQLINTLSKFVQLEKSHLDILGNEDNDLQFPNILLNFLTLFVFHLYISGSDINDSQPLKISSILETFSVFHLEISGIVFSDLQFANILLISLRLFKLIILYISSVTEESKKMFGAP